MKPHRYLLTFLALFAAFAPAARADQNFDAMNLAATVAWLKTCITKNGNPYIPAPEAPQGYTNVVYNAGVLTITADAKVDGGGRTVIVRQIYSVKLSEVQVVQYYKDAKKNISAATIAAQPDSKNITFQSIYDAEGVAATQPPLPQHCVIYFDTHHQEARDCTAALQHLITLAAH